MSEAVAEAEDRYEVSDDFETPQNWEDWMCAIVNKAIVRGNVPALVERCAGVADAMFGRDRNQREPVGDWRLWTPSWSSVALILFDSMVQDPQRAADEYSPAACMLGLMGNAADETLKVERLNVADKLTILSPPHLGSPQADRRQRDVTDPRI